MKKGQKKRRSVILRRILAFLLAIVLIHSQIMPAVFAADTNYSQESNTEEKTVVDGAETVLPMSEDAISEPSEPIQSEEQQTEDKVSEDTTIESSEPIQSGEQQTEDTADAEQSPEVETTDEAAEETVNIADAVVPVTVNYYLPKSQNLQVDAPESYTEGEAQEEAKSAVIEQALGDETTQKLIEQQKEKGIESNTQELTASAVSEEEYDSYTQMAVTGEGLQAPEVSLSDDVQLEEDADAENTNPLIGWQVAKTAGIMLSYPDGTEIKMGDVIPADKISEVQMTAADDGISLLSTQANMSIASLIALTQDMTVVQRVGPAGTNGKWSVLVQGGTNQTPSAGTVRHAYGTLENALIAINTDTTSNSFKITFLDNYTANSNDISAMGSPSSTSGVLGKRTTNKPTIVFTGATNYSTGTSYSSWTTFTSQNQRMYFNGFNAYFTHVNLNWSESTVYGNQNDTTFDDVKFVGGAVTAIYGGRYTSNSTNVSYNLKFEDVEMTKDAPVKKIFGGGQANSTGTINLTMTNCTIYGNVYASSGPYWNTTYTHTGSVYATLKDTAIRKFDTTDADAMLNPTTIHTVGGSFWGLYGTVTEYLDLNASGSYSADCGTWFTAKQDCTARYISYKFNDIKENLRFVGAYQYPGYDRTEENKGMITVNKAQVANVFGWGWLNLINSSTCSEEVNNFGHMQYDSSFYNYWTEKKKQDKKGGNHYVPGTYKPDLTGCKGYVQMTSSNIYSGGDCYDYTTGWNRQRFGRIVLMDNYNTFRIYNAIGGNGTNVVDVDYLDTISYSYKATVELMARPANTTASDAFSMIRTRQQDRFSTSVYAIGTLKTHANVSCTMAQDTTNRLIKLYTTNGQNTIYLYSGSSNTGTALYSADSFATVLDFLRKQSGISYTLWFTRGYTLIQEDVTEFNDPEGFTNKNVTMIVDSVLSGSNEQGSPSTGVNLWGTVYPQFKSLTWKNAKFRSDLLSVDKYSYAMHGNGHNLTFENCIFTGDVTINAGGNSTQGTSGSTLTLKNCVNVNKIYASRHGGGLGNTTINVESCTGHTGSIIIDPAYYGTVNNLEINVTDCIAKIEPSYISSVKVEGDYKLTATNTQLMFTNPTVSSGHTAKVYLNKDSLNHEVVLWGDCKGADNAPAGSTSLYVTAKVRTKDSTSVNLDYFDQIEINGGELHLGDAAHSMTCGFGNSTRKANISLKNSGKLMLDNLMIGAPYRIINSLKTDSTNTEVSVTYDYISGTTSPGGRPLIIKNALTVPSNSKLRISTTLAPKHKGTVEYPLIQFNSSNNAKLEQYNWIADKQYYLAIASQNSNQIVLRADTCAPLVYQAKTTRTAIISNERHSGELEIYLKDLYRDGIDKNGSSIHDASDGAYPTGFQVYFSSQDVQLKDGVYGYTYNSSTDIQLKSSNASFYEWMNSGSFTDINGTSVTATTESPVLHLKLNTTYQTNTNYFIYARDIAGNWSKFLLDTKGPTSTYTNIRSTKVSDTTYRYTFTGLKFTDPIKTATYGTSDIADESYIANATQYIQSSKKIAEVRYNKTGEDPWSSGVSYSTASLDKSTGACTLNNVSVSVTEKLYVFVKDGYGNISRFIYVPIVFDAQSGGATSTGKFRDGSTTSSTLGLVGSTLNSAQAPSSPVLGNQTFRYWYNSKDSGKYQVSLTSETVSDETTYYYPQWTYPTLTISNQVTGSVADKNKKFTYTIYAQRASGNRYNGQAFPYTGGTIAGISGVTAPANGTKTSNNTGEFTIQLSHGQSVTIQLPGYYDDVSVRQGKESPYWTVYTTEENKKYNQNYREQISVNATNRSLAFVNSNDSSQPVIYQQKMEGEWTKDQGDNYGRKLTVYIRDLYGDGIDTQGSSFSTSERAEFPGCRYAQVYLSTYDAPKADRGFKFRYTDTESVPLESLFSCRKLTSGSFTDIEGKTVTATSEKPIWEFKMFSTYKFDQNKNYFIYVRDLTGKWTKYLLDTKGPRIENTGIITKSKENDNDTEFKISKIQVKDEMIDVANGTSDLTNESQENFTYVANATKYKGTEVSLVRNNKTGKFSDTYKTPTKATEGTYTAVESMNNGEMLYVYAQDYYGNTTAQQYVLVGFDASGNAQYKKAIFKDKTRLKRELVAKGQKLSSSQIPSDPGFYNDTTSQKFTQWSDSTDANKKKVDLKTAQMTKSVILNADYDKPSVIIKQMIKGDGIWNNQEFTYKVKTSYPKGKVIPCKGSYVSPAVNAPNITSLTVDANQEITFKLKAGQSLELIPGDNQYTIKSIIQDSNGTNCEIQKDAKVISSVENVDVDEISTNFVFTNTKNIVVTGVDGGNTDNSLLLVGLMGVLLITGVSVLRVRGRRRS